jgi:hypothetical protein
MVQVPLRFTGPPGRPTPKPPAPTPPRPPAPPVRPVSAPSAARGPSLDSPSVANRRAQQDADLRSIRTPASGGGGGGGGGGTGGGSSGGGGGGGGGGWQDAAYNEQIAAINRALADFETKLGQKTSDYGTDYLTGIRQLGYRPGEDWSANVDIFSLPIFEQTDKKGRVRPATPSSEVIAKAVQEATPGLQGGWDYEGNFNPFSAASRGTRTSRDDFAGRGLLRSSDFAQSYAQFQDRLQEQLNSMETGRSRFYRDSAIGLGGERASAEERRQAARRDAVLRAAVRAGG